MAFTGLLGTADSTPGNLVPGFVAAGGATIVATRATTWAVVAAATTVGASRATTWVAAANTVSVRPTTWTVSTPSVTSRNTTWVALSSTSSIRATTYNVSARTTGTRLTTWSVASTIVTVAGARATTWSVIGRVATSRTTTWNVSVVPVLLFTPPFFHYHINSRFHFPGTDEGITVLKEGSGYRQVSNPTNEDVAAATIAYLGGRSYPVTAAEAAALTAAGYGSNIK